MTTSTLTSRQKAVLDLVRQTIEKQGYPPSLREIAAHFRMVGTRGAEKHILALEKKGYIRKGSGARALEVVGQKYSRSIPILGKVAAGQPILAEENRLGNLMVDPSIARCDDAFLLKVKGESMIDAGILDGDLVLVKPQPDAESGEIVVAMVEGEATVKRLIKKRSQVVLQPENPAFFPIVMTGRNGILQIIGKVVGLIRLDF
ncbi:MAG: transcriptional repressor LexA [Nitrospiria bacterium]